MMRRRAQPLLGTLVEVRAQGASATAFDVAADAAFEAVAQVHALMSFHEAGSDVRRIARARAGERLAVHPHTAAVLRRAQRWARASGGAFDAGCAPRAVARGWLPAPDDAAPPGELPFEDALQVEGREVLVHAPAWLDFGGIAKGYAVDLAVSRLRRAGVHSGVVNAGGDLRVFGTLEETVLVRSPFDASELWPVAALRDSACATSASGAVARRAASQDDTPVPCSVTVLAPTACAADALTKIVWQQGELAVALLRRARARALVVRADGSVWQS
ncbi:MAG: FAD:protein FMN transferase [Vitreoscilla sp.]